MTTNTREFLEEQLRRGICMVVFTKGDGTVRELECTLLDSYIAKHGYSVTYDENGERAKPKNENMLPVWDIESEGWRSFKVDSVISVDILI